MDRAVPKVVFVEWRLFHALVELIGIASAYGQE